MRPPGYQLGHGENSQCIFVTEFIRSPLVLAGNLPASVNATGYRPRPEVVKRATDDSATAQAAGAGGELTLSSSGQQMRLSHRLNSVLAKSHSIEQPPAAGIVLCGNVRPSSDTVIAKPEARRVGGFPAGLCGGTCRARRIRFRFRDVTRPLSQC